MKSVQKLTILMLPALALPGLATGCQLPPAHLSALPDPQQTWAPERMVRLEPGATTLQKLYASANEYTGFAFTVRSTKAVSKPRLAVKDPAGPPGAEPLHISLARIHRVSVDRFPGWHVRSVPPSRRDMNPLDVLVPLDAPEGGMPSRLVADLEYHFWVEVMAPKGSAAGEYVLPIMLESAGRPIGTLKIQLTVWPMALPDESDVMAIGEVGLVDLLRHFAPVRSGVPIGATVWHGQGSDPVFDQVVLSTFRLLQEHRVAPVAADLGPRVTVGTRGEPALDWSGFDRIVAPLLDGTAFSNRIPLPVWPLPLNQTMANSEGGTTAARDAQSNTTRYIQECADHFKERGWLDRSYAVASSSAPYSQESITQAREFSGMIRQAFHGVRVAVHGFPYDMKPFGWFDFPTGLADVQPEIWITDARYFDPRAMAGEHSKGREVWLKAGHPPYCGTSSLYARPGDTLALGWLAEYFGAGGLWLGRVNGWPDEPKATLEQCARHDPEAIIFPGTQFGLTGPVPTLRLKRIRESMQYLAYSKMLRQHGRGAVADSIRASLVHHAGTLAYRTHFADGRSEGWETSEQAYEVSRRIMAGEMLEVVGATNLLGETPRGDELAWRRTEGNRRGLRLLVDGARFRIAGTPESAEVLVDIWSTLFNPGHSAVAAEVTLTGVPPECEATEPGRPLELAAGKSARTLLSMNCEPGWCFNPRAAELEIEIATANEPPRRAPVRPSLVVAEPTTSPLKVDGDLADWAPAAGNVATDFRLIAGECEDFERGCASPRRKTFAFLRRDAENLYIAINAEAQPQSASTARRTTMHYDDLIPVDDEDLVELLIDPVNSGTRSSNDLYHIVIKRSGVAQSERGITTSPPLGPRRPWIAEMEVASRASSDRWTAEVRIPLSSFGKPGPVHGEIWGLNVTHYEAAGQEFSTWSGAVGNAYDPLSLGNLLLP